MPTSRQSQTDDVRTLIDAIAAEKVKLEECLDNIREYAERLRAVSADAQRRLIGRG